MLINLKNKAILKKQQRFRIKNHNVFTEVINKIALSKKMIKEYSHLIQQKHVHMERAKI